MDIVYGIMLDNGSGYNARCDSSLGLHVGDFCVIRKDFLVIRIPSESSVTSPCTPPWSFAFMESAVACVAWSTI